jgi:chorismate lyase / 3-hydroxybenzoate synthase
MPLTYGLLTSDEISSRQRQCLLVVDAGGPDLPHSINTGLVDLDSPDGTVLPLIEAWLSDDPIDRGDVQGVSWACDGNDLFAAYKMDDDIPLREAAKCAYEQILSVVAGFDSFTICRVWNYVHDINGAEFMMAGDAAVERYWHFNQGRLDVYSQLTNCEHYPAASAIGVVNRNCVYLQATRDRVEYFENPRQVSAFDYPNQYGPASPSFSRATLVTGASGRRIYISGTASIVGHETLHADDLDGQLDTTFDNISLLLAGISASAGEDEAVGLTLLKVYVRHENDLPFIRARVEAQYPGVPKRYLGGDICRKELLVELEGLAELLSRPG